MTLYCAMHPDRPAAAYCIYLSRPVCEECRKDCAEHDGCVPESEAK